jgi:hypothetical protein
MTRLPDKALAREFPALTRDSNQTTLEVGFSAVHPLGPPMTDDAKTRELTEVLRRVPTEVVEKLGPLLGEVVGQLVSEKLKEFLPAWLDDFQDALGVTEEVGSLASRLSREYRMPPSDILLKALGLFKLALEARARGNRLAILDGNDEIVQEIVGFEPSRELLQPTGR